LDSSRLRDFETSRLRDFETSSAASCFDLFYKRIDDERRFIFLHVYAVVLTVISSPSTRSPKLQTADVMFWVIAGLVKVYCPRPDGTRILV
jgi:hypothetical protein